jgi:hypothetical protein
MLSVYDEMSGPDPGLQIKESVFARTRRNKFGKFQTGQESSLYA